MEYEIKTITDARTRVEIHHLCFVDQPEAGWFTHTTLNIFKKNKEVCSSLMIFS